MDVALLHSRSLRIEHALEEFVPSYNGRTTSNNELFYNEQLATFLSQKGLHVLLTNSFTDVIGTDFAIECKSFVRSQEAYKLVGQMYVCRSTYPEKLRFVVVYEQILTPLNVVEFLKELDVVVVVKDGAHSGRLINSDTNPTVQQQQQLNKLQSVNSIIQQFEDERAKVLARLTPEYASANPLVVKHATCYLGYNPWECGLDGLGHQKQEVGAAHDNDNRRT